MYYKEKTSHWYAAAKVFPSLNHFHKVEESDFLSKKNVTRPGPFEDGLISIRNKTKTTVGSEGVTNKEDCYKNGGLGTLCEV